MKTIKIKDNFKDYILVLVGILSISFALKSLLIPNHFYDGGITGIALLVHEKFHLNIALIFVVFNIPFLLLGAKLIGKTFALKSFLAIIILGLFLLFIPYPVITHDKLIIAVFGGFKS